MFIITNGSLVRLCSCGRFPSPVAEGPYAGVVKLQTMRCLFEAYEHVLSLLENVFTPMFCHSDEVRTWVAKGGYITGNFQSLPVN